MKKIFKQLWTNFDLIFYIIIIIFAFDVPKNIKIFFTINDKEMAELNMKLSYDLGYSDAAWGSACISKVGVYYDGYSEGKKSFLYHCGRRYRRDGNFSGSLVKPDILDIFTWSFLKGYFSYKSPSITLIDENGKHIY